MRVPATMRAPGTFSRAASSATVSLSIRVESQLTLQCQRRGGDDPRAAAVVEHARSCRQLRQVGQQQRRSLVDAAVGEDAGVAHPRARRTANRQLRRPPPGRSAAYAGATHRPAAAPPARGHARASPAYRRCRTAPPACRLPSECPHRCRRRRSGGRPRRACRDRRAPPSPARLSPSAGAAARHRRAPATATAPPPARPPRAGSRPQPRRRAAPAATRRSPD